MNRKQKLARLVAVVSLVSILASLMPFPLAPKEAKAVVPVADAPAITGIFSQLFQFLFEWAQSFVLEILKRQILDLVIDQVLKWVQGGGAPQFITNWEAFVGDTLQKASGRFLGQIGQVDFCAPFAGLVRESIRTESLGAQPARGLVDSGGGFAKRAKCTLDGILESVSPPVFSIQDYYNDFRNGGWKAFGATLLPQNTFYGAYVMSLEQLEDTRGSAAAAAVNEGLAGGGFLPTKSCANDDPSLCITTTPAGIVKDLTSKALGSDIDYIVNADQLAQFLASLATLAMNRLITTGVSGLLGLATKNAPPGGAITGQGGCADLAGGLRIACDRMQSIANGNWDQAVTILDTEIDHTLAPLREARGLADDSIRLVTEHRDAVRGLRDRINGPPPRNCSLDPSLPNDVDRELNRTDVLLSSITATRDSQIEPFQRPLEDAVSTKHALRQDRWDLLSQLAQDVRSRLDQARAEVLRNDQQGIHDDIIDRDLPGRRAALETRFAAGCI